MLEYEINFLGEFRGCIRKFIHRCFVWSFAFPIDTVRERMRDAGVRASCRLQKQIGTEQVAGVNRSSFLRKVANCSVAPATSEGDSGVLLSGLMN